MSEIKALERLRELCDNAKSGGFASIGCDAVLEIADEIEAEIAEKYLELPLDADGVPIRVGDTLYTIGNRKYEGNRCVVIGIGEGNLIYTRFEDGGDINQSFASKFTHVKPRTLESILCEALANVSCMSDGIVMRFEPDDPYVAELADEIRGMMAEGE